MLQCTCARALCLLALVPRPAQSLKPPAACSPAVAPLDTPRRPQPWTVLWLGEGSVGGAAGGPRTAGHGPHHGPDAGEQRRAGLPGGACRRGAGRRVPLGAAGSSSRVSPSSAPPTPPSPPSPARCSCSCSTPRWGQPRATAWAADHVIPQVLTEPALQQALGHVLTWPTLLEGHKVRSVFAPPDSIFFVSEQNKAPEAHPAAPLQQRHALRLPD